MRTLFTAAKIGWQPPTPPLADEVDGKHRISSPKKQPGNAPATLTVVAY
jgi:hypothetical protein